MQSAIAERLGQVRMDRSMGNGMGRGLSVVPIVGPAAGEPVYALFGGGVMNKVEVTEVSAAGSVPVVRVKNWLDVRVFLMDGQELVGAKQNRILNTDVLVPAGASLDIPVSCVEQGRWRPNSATFSPGKAASHRTRSAKLKRVHDSLKESGRHDANQGAVWDEVEQSLAAADADGSGTRALSDAYARREVEIATFRHSLVLPEGTIGLAVFFGGRFQGLDLFDRPDTLRSLWESLVDSYAVDFLGAPMELGAAAQTDEAKVTRQVLDWATGGEWESFASPGEGRDWRVATPEVSAAALIWEERVVLHLQVYPADSGRRGRRVRVRGV